MRTQLRRARGTLPEQKVSGRTSWLQKRKDRDLAKMSKTMLRNGDLQRVHMAQGEEGVLTLFKPQGKGSVPFGCFWTERMSEG